MYTFGIIRLDQPRVLLNPVGGRSPEELRALIDELMLKNQWELDQPLSLENLATSLEQPEPLTLLVKGKQLAILLGCDAVIYEATDSFQHQLPR
jgi:hypothetical protein